MTFFTRRRGSKKLQARGRGGRFTRPSLGANVCEHCGQIVLPQMTEGPFPMPKMPEDCPNCGKPLEKPLMKHPREGDRVRVAKTVSKPARWGTVVGVQHPLSFEVRFDDNRIEVMPPTAILEHHPPDKSTKCPSCNEPCGADNCSPSAGNRCCDDCPLLKELY